MTRDANGNLIFGASTARGMTVRQTPLGSGSSSRGGGGGDTQSSLMNAQASMMNAGTNAYSANINAYSAHQNAALGHANLGLNKATGQSNAAAQRAQLELAMASNRVSPYAESILRSAREDAEQIDQKYVGALADIQGLGEQQIRDYEEMMEGVGEASRERIYRDSIADRNSVGSQLAGTGLYNSTVLGTMQMGVDRNRNEAIGMLDEGLRRERAQFLTDMTGKALDRRMSLMQGQLDAAGNMAGQRLSADASMRGAQGTDATIDQSSLNAITAPINNYKIPAAPAAPPAYTGGAGGGGTAASGGGGLQLVSGQWFQPGAQIYTASGNLYGGINGPRPM